MCSESERVRFLTQVQGWGGGCSLSCQRALTEKEHYSGGGALEIGDHRLLEDGCERGGALVSDLVVPNTAKHG